MVQLFFILLCWKSTYGSAFKGGYYQDKFPVKRGEGSGHFQENFPTYVDLPKNRKTAYNSLL